MAFGVPTDLTTILNAITTALTSSPFALPSTGQPFAPAQVLPTLARDQDLEAMPMKDIFLAIRPSRFPIDRQDRAGGGRQLLAVDGSLELLFFSRLWLGPINNDAQALIDASYGVLANWKAILNALEQFAPLDPAGSGDSILRQPMRVEQFDVVPRRTNKRGWTRLDSTWEIKFVQALS